MLHIHNLLLFCKSSLARPHADFLLIPVLTIPWLLTRGSQIECDLAPRKLGSDVDSSYHPHLLSRDSLFEWTTLMTSMGFLTLPGFVRRTTPPGPRSSLRRWPGYCGSHPEPLCLSTVSSEHHLRYASICQNHQLRCLRVRDETVTSQNMNMQGNAQEKE